MENLKNGDKIRYVGASEVGLTKGGIYTALGSAGEGRYGYYDDDGRTRYLLSGMLDRFEKVGEENPDVSDSIANLGRRLSEVEEELERAKERKYYDEMVDSYAKKGGEAVAKTPKVGYVVRIIKSEECPESDGLSGVVTDVDEDGYFDVDIPSGVYGDFTFVDPSTDVYEITERPVELGVADDMVDSPPHYTQGAVEVIDYIDQVADGYEGRQAVYAGNVIKYVSRAPYKNQAQDIRKAIWYAERLADALEAKASE